MGGVFVRNTGSNWEHVSRGNCCGRLELESSFNQKIVKRSKCPNKHFHGQVRGLTNAYRSSSRWHTRAWAQAVIRGVEERRSQKI